MELSKKALDDLRVDLVEKLHTPKGSNISLQLDFKFKRAEPSTALEAFMKNNRTLNFTHFNDCVTGQELRQWAHFTCGRIKDKSLSTQIIFTQAYNPGLVLGQNNWITEVN